MRDCRARAGGNEHLRRMFVYAAPAVLCLVRYDTAASDGGYISLKHVTHATDTKPGGVLCIPIWQQVGRATAKPPAPRLNLYRGESPLTTGSLAALHSL
jgi:hypothetical protein